MFPLEYSVTEYGERMIDRTPAYNLNQNGKTVKGKLLKLKQINIRIEEQPQLITMGDYWNTEIVNQVTSLFLEYKDVFASSYKDLKGILPKLEEHRIELIEEAKPVMPLLDEPQL